MKIYRVAEYDYDVTVFEEFYTNHDKAKKAFISQLDKTKNEFVKRLNEYHKRKEEIKNNYVNEFDENTRVNMKVFENTVKKIDDYIFKDNEDNTVDYYNVISFEIIEVNEDAE